MREIGYTRAAIRDLQRIPEKDRHRPREKIAQYADDPAALGNNVTGLTGGGGKRLRVGDWRVLFTESERRMDVYRIRKRGEAYRR